MGTTFTWACRFWLLVHEYLGVGYGEHMASDMSSVEPVYSKLLQWSNDLPDNAKSVELCSHHVLILQFVSLPLDSSICADNV